jgi:hypothetical protein
MICDENILASASGILQCLRLLAEEAATLNLHRTLSAIQEALETATEESGGDDFQEGYASGAAAFSLH